MRRKNQPTLQFDKPKFTQIAIAQYEGADGKLRASTIALGDDGRVYQHSNRNGFWTPLSDKIAWVE